MEKIDKKKPNRLSNLEYLGLDMISAGNEFGPGTSYGMHTTHCSYVAEGHFCTFFSLKSIPHYVELDCSYDYVEQFAESVKKRNKHSRVFDTGAE